MLKSSVALMFRPSRRKLSVGLSLETGFVEFAFIHSRYFIDKWFSHWSLERSTVAGLAGKSSLGLSEWRVLFLLAYDCHFIFRSFFFFSFPPPSPYSLFHPFFFLGSAESVLADYFEGEWWVGSQAPPFGFLFIFFLILFPELNRRKDDFVRSTQLWVFVLMKK